MPISSPGLGSGLDVTSIVSQLMEVERQPLTRLNNREALVQAQISSYGSLKGGMAALQSSMADLQDALTFQTTQSSSSDSEVLGVSSDPDAVSSSYSVTVDRLAQQHKLGSAEFLSTDSFGGGVGDAMTFVVDGVSFDLDLSGGMTLTEIQAAINVETNEAGITAGLITGDNGNQTLVLTSDKSGYADRIQLSFGGTLDSDTFSFSMLNRDADGALLTAETELKSAVTIDGVSVTRSGNEIADVIEGVTLNLKAAGTATIGISQDTSVGVQAVQSFVTEYNLLKEQVNALASTGVNGSMLRNIDSSLRGILNNGVSGLGDFSYISELGVTTDPETGKLQFDSSRMVSAIEERPDSVIGFFSTEEEGFAYRMDSMLQNFLESGGAIDGLVNTANNRVDSIERSRESLERRMESVERRYLRQFGALDTLMASMTTTSEYLTSQLDNLSNLYLRNNN